MCRDFVDTLIHPTLVHSFFFLYSILKNEYTILYLSIPTVVNICAVQFFIITNSAVEGVSCRTWCENWVCLSGRGMVHPEQMSANRTANISGFASQAVSVKTTLPHLYSMKAAVDNTKTSEHCVPIKLPSGFPEYKPVQPHLKRPGNYLVFLGEWQCPCSPPCSPVSICSPFIISCLEDLCRAENTSCFRSTDLRVCVCVCVSVCVRERERLPRTQEEKWGTFPHTVVGWSLEQWKPLSPQGQDVTRPQRMAPWWTLGGCPIESQPPGSTVPAELPDFRNHMDIKDEISQL